MKLDNYECEGQLSIFDFLPKNEPEETGAIHRFLRYGPHTLIPEVENRTRAYLEKHGVPEWVTWDKLKVPCDNCTWYDGRACCSGGHTNHFEFGFLICDGFCQSITERKPSTVGDALPSKLCSFSGHTCNKQALWEIADTLDDIKCPHSCCRNCSVRFCGARCNGSEEPKKTRKEELDEKYDIPRGHQKEEGWTDDWHYTELETPQENSIYYCIHYGLNSNFYNYTYMAWAYGHWWAYAGYGEKWLLVRGERRKWMEPFAWVTVPDLYYRTDKHHQFLCEHFVTKEDWEYEERIAKLHGGRRNYS